MGASNSCERVQVNTTSEVTATMDGRAGSSEIEPRRCWHEGGPT